MSPPNLSGFTAGNSKGTADANCPERPEFNAGVQALLARAGLDVDEWGLQNFEVLGLAIAQNTGELCQAILEAKNKGPKCRIHTKAIDLGALCLQVLKYFP